MQNTTAETLEQLLSNTEKLEVLLETVVMYHLDGTTPKLNALLNLIEDLNTANKKELAKVLSHV